MLATVHQPLAHNPALAVLAGCLGELDAELQEELAHCGILAVQLDRETEVWVGVDQRSRPSRSPTSAKVLVVLEPPDVKALCVDGFDLVLTWQREHLEALPNAHRFLAATPWLLPAEWPRFHGDRKRPGLGFLRGAKKRTAGHQLRHEIWVARELLAARAQVPLCFEEGCGAPRDVRNRQFECHFVLVVENSRHANYFTEKLLDAVLARCVPVYWGCANLAEFFDVSGVVEVSGGLDEVVAACSSLTEADYTSRSAALERNFESARAFAGDFGLRVQRAISGCWAAGAPAPGAAAEDQRKGRGS